VKAGLVILGMFFLFALVVAWIEWACRRQIKRWRKLRKGEER